MRRILFGCICLLLFLAACQPETEEAPTEELEETPTTPVEPALSYTDLFSYDTVRSYVYEATIGETTATTAAEISSTTYEDVPAYKVLNKVAAGGVETTTTMYIRKDTHACLALQVAVPIGDELLEQDVDCPAEGLNSAATADVTITHVGTETVTVPAGTFTADEYVVENMHFWRADDVPIPLQYSTDDFTMVLVSYE